MRALEGRDESDTFPTYYRANSARQVRRIADRTGFEIERLEFERGGLCVLMGLLWLVDILRLTILDPAAKVLVDGLAYSANVIGM